MKRFAVALLASVMALSSTALSDEIVFDEGLAVENESIEVSADVDVEDHDAFFTEWEEETAVEGLADENVIDEEWVIDPSEYDESDEENETDIGEPEDGDDALLAEDFLIEEIGEESNVLADSDTSEPISITTGEAAVFTFPEGSFTRTFTFVPEEDGMYDVELNLPNVQYDVDWSIEYANVTTSSSQITEPGSYSNMIYGEALKIGSTCKITFKCVPVEGTGEAGNGSVRVIETEGMTRVAMNLEESANMARDTYYVFTAPEDGVYEIAIDSYPIEGELVAWNWGRVSVILGETKDGTEFEVNEQKTTNKFRLNKGDSALIDLYYNGSDTRLEGTLTPKKASGYTVTWDAGKGFIGFDYEDDVDDYTNYVNVYADPDIYEEGDYLLTVFDAYRMKYDGHRFKGWLIGNTGNPLPEYDYDEQRIPYQITGNVTFHADWEEIPPTVPVVFNANGQTFYIEDYETDGIFNADNTLLTMQAPVGTPLGRSWYDREEENYYYYTWTPYCVGDDYVFGYWSTDAAGTNRVEWIETDNDEILMCVDGEALCADKTVGLTLYANWMKKINVIIYYNDGSGLSETVQMFVDGEYLVILEDDCPCIYGPGMIGYALDAAGQQMVELDGRFNERDYEYYVYLKVNAIDGLELYSIWDNDDEPPHTHSYGNWTITTPATCTTTGVKTGKCSCGDTKTEIIPATGIHTSVTDPAVAATATSTGLTEGSHCSVCGTVLVAQQTIPMTEQITVTKNPSIKKPEATTNKITINWANIKTTSKKTKAVWKKIKKTQIQCATDRAFKNIVKTTTVGKNKTKAAIKGLKKNTTYYVRVRYFDGTGYSKWSSVKKIKTKKK